MAIDFSSIPIIDISPLLAKSDDPKMADDPAVLDVVTQLDKACTQAGFFYVKGHGIPDTLLKGVRDITRRFFELPYEEKAKIKMTPATGFRGYEKIGENITEGAPDMHEAIDCYREVTKGMYGDLGKVMEGYNQWPQNPPKFRVLMEEYISLCKDLAKKIMRGIALGLGGSPYEFEGDRAGDPFWVMRIIGYPGLSSVNDIGCGAHTDYGLLTLLNQDDDINALQVRNLSGEWISAPPIPGTFVCNIGDMLKAWCNSTCCTPLLAGPVWTEPAESVKRAYSETDSTILEKSDDLGRGGSTAVTAILINCQKLVVANIGDSRAVLSENGVAIPLSVDHEPTTESDDIKNRGGFVSNFPGDVPRVDGQLAVSRAFGDKSLKIHMTSEPHVTVKVIDDGGEFVILASDGLWKVMSNQEAVDAIRDIKDARSAAKHLTEEALNRKSSDDISCIVVRFH